MLLNNKEVIKACRKAARENGMTFKAMERLRINNGPAYKYVSRKTGESIRSNLDLGTAYDIACSGELADEYYQSKI